MNRVGQVFFAAILLFLFIQVVIGFPIPLEQKPESTTPPEILSKKEQALVMDKFHLVESREGNRDWELFADEAVGSKGQGDWELSKVRVQFYSNAKVEFTVTGDKGTMDSATRDLKIVGHVVTTSSNGYVFETSEMEYKSNQRYLRSRSAVKVTGPKDPQGGYLRVDGGMMESHVDAEEIQILGGVTARRILTAARMFTIKSGALKLSGKNASAHFFKQVQIEVDSMRIEGPEARFEYRTGTDFLRSVLIRGGVQVSDVDKFATADVVRFDPELNEFVLSGSPRLVQNQDELTGEQITFIDGGKKVKVERKTEKAQ